LHRNSQIIIIIITNFYNANQPISSKRIELSDALSQMVGKSHNQDTMQIGCTGNLGGRNKPERGVF